MKDCYRIGHRVAFYPGTTEHRPSLWMVLRRSELVIWFGWQKPSVQWLR